MAAVIAMAWFPPAADALARRDRVPAPPGIAALWAMARRGPGRSLAAAATSAAMSAAMVVRFGSAPADGLVAMTVLGGGVLSAMVDVRCHRLPDAITAPLWAVAWPVMVVVALAGGDATRIRSSLVAGVVAAVVLGIGWLAGMGLGDVKLGALLALVAGWMAPDAVAAAGAALALVLLATCAAVAGTTGRWLGHVLAGWLGGWLGGRLVVLRRWTVAQPDRWFAFGPHLVVAAMVVVAMAGPPAGA